MQQEPISHCIKHTEEQYDTFFLIKGYTSPIYFRIIKYHNRRNKIVTKNDKSAIKKEFLMKFYH